jgi:hypothetical protein
MKRFIAVIIGLLILVGGFYSFKVCSGYKEYQVKKEHLAEVTRINYGLFNMVLWKAKAVEIFADKISKFEISSTAYKDVKVELEKYLNTVYRDHIESGAIFNQVFEDAEKAGKVNKFLLKLFKDNIAEQITNLDIKGHIPQMATQMANELKNNEPRIKEVIKSELGWFLEDKNSYTYVDPRLPIYKLYNEDTLDSTVIKLNTAIEAEKIPLDKHRNLSYSLLLLACIIALAFYKVIGKQLMVSFVTIGSIILLILGVSLPMINIDARLNKFIFSLFGNDVSFDEQSLYYQSKSILDVTTTLIESKGFDLKIVGLLILCFSVVFPAIKLVLSSLFVYSDKIAESKLVQNIIFYLGKWSMADVFVVAMFMAYIGFEGIVSNQLRGIERNESGFAIETVNYSGLSVGALYFTTYCILSIILGIIINKSHLNTE